VPQTASTIRARCTDVDTAARNIDHIVSHTLLPQLATEFLTCMAALQPTRSVALGIGADGQIAYCMG
jgi:type VI secretion system protein VasG